MVIEIGNIVKSVEKQLSNIEKKDISSQLVTKIDKQIFQLNKTKIEEQVTKVPFDSSIFSTGTNKIDLSGLQNSYISKSISQTFKTPEDAFKYGKDKIITALHTKNPYEHFVAVDRNKVLLDITGNSEHISIDPVSKSKLTRNTRLLHGHPGDMAPPVSLGDFRFLKSTNAPEVIAFNKQGEFSSLAKTPSYKKLSNEELLKLKEKYDIHILKFYKEQIANINTSDEFLKLLESIDNSGADHSSQIHKFWLKHADELGLEYKTNYSYLV